MTPSYMERNSFPRYWTRIRPVRFRLCSDLE